MTMQERLASAYGYVREQTDLRPELGLVLGSGLGDFCDRLEETVEIPFGDIPGFPVSTVEGHAGALLLGTGNVEEDYGYMEIRLNELLKKKGLSKNKLSHKAEMNWKQIDNYCTNSITRLDVYVLCKLCTVLGCEIQDLLVFHPPGEE